MDPITIMAGAALLGGGLKSVLGGAQAKKAREAIMNYERQDLENVFDDIKISTLGTDMMREENARALATGTQALRSGGTDSLLAGVPKLVAQNTASNRAAQLDLDQQFQDRERLIAQDNATIRAMEERREEGDLAGLGQQLNVGRQDMMAGFGDMTSALMLGANGFGGEGGSSVSPDLISAILGAQNTKTPSLDLNFNTRTYF